MTGTGPNALTAMPIEEVKIDTLACEDEPIRIPGSIQRHGFLLMLDERDEKIVAASENAEEFLDTPLKLLLGATVDAVLAREMLAAVRALSTSDETAGMATYLGAFQMRGELCSVVTHLLDGQRVLEFERLDRLVSPELMNAVITNFVGALGKLSNELQLCQAITGQVKDLTGFNRVLLYCFDEAGHGEVLAEENDGALPSYLHLRFPASDIPKQARDLYVLNTVRSIPDANYVPSPLRGMAGKPMATTDLSLSVLRSVSPIHLEYMRNMGTISSMSISIVCEGRLWGLISGHHKEPRTVPYLVRSACDLLTKIMGTQLIGFRTASNLSKMVHFHAVQRTMLTQIAAENNHVAAMMARMSDLAQVTGALGVALVTDGRCERWGGTPDEAILLRLAEWMDARPEMELFESDHLSREFAWADEIREVASGVLVVRISDVRQSYILWFRPEVVVTVKWAGEPGKVREQGGSLSPRTSFGDWKEIVRGQSEPWTPIEIESARDFRTAVMTISLKRAEEAIELSEARFQQLTHALPNLVWTADDDGQLSYVNQTWRDAGLGSEGRWYEEGRVIAEDEDRCRERWTAAVAEGTAFEEEVRFRRSADDAERWNLVRAIPFRRANQSRAGWIGTCTDLTDRREREMALRMAEKLALTGRMTSVIAHEINNPLESITNLLYLLRQEVEGNAPARDYIGMAEYELERISGITKQTLRWSKEGVQKAGNGTAGAVFDDALRLFAAKISNRQAKVEMLGDTEVVFFGVMGQIRQVMANLISNAVDAVPVGGRIWLEAMADGEMMEMVVADNGSGMSDEIQRQIFQPFYSTKGDLGNGLGLYISQEIVERHRGELIVESAVGEGTRARVRLPAKE
jgi:PAS domain S-box-containing protein